MKKLPKLYKNENSNITSHNRREYRITDSLFEEEDNINILDEIFNGFSHPYTQKVLIKTSKKEYITYLVSRTKQNLLTLDNDIIPLKDILSIKKID